STPINDEVMDGIDRLIHTPDLDKAMLTATGFLTMDELRRLVDVKSEVAIDLVNGNYEDIDQLMLNNEIDFTHLLILYLGLFDVPKDENIE
ncbi:MAG: hypothetical protein AAB914_03305, partial [Patescibacteria group bacterium]